MLEIEQESGEPLSCSTMLSRYLEDKTSVFKEWKLHLLLKRLDSCLLAGKGTCGQIRCEMLVLGHGPEEKAEHRKG